jgi:peroxiredoxin
VVTAGEVRQQVDKKLIQKRDLLVKLQRVIASYPESEIKACAAEFARMKKKYHEQLKYGLVTAGLELN